MVGLIRLLAFGAIFLAVRAIAADDSTPKLNVKTRKSEDRVQVRGDARQVVLSVTSPSGIGSATIERAANEWPAAVALELHLSGLESFAVSNGKVKLNVSVSSSDGKSRVRLWIDDKESEPLDPKSPYWMDVRILGADGKPAQELPLRNGHIEMILPRAMFGGNPQSLSVQWIDFYRG
jgi:hypothetical protein